MDSDENRGCINCKNYNVDNDNEPCVMCNGESGWESKITNENKKVNKSCDNCKDSKVDMLDESCCLCSNYSKWKSGWTVENMNKNEDIEEDINEIDDNSEEEIHRLKFKNEELETELEIYKASEKEMTANLNKKIKRLNEMDVSNKLITNKESIMHSILKTLESWQGDDKECLNIENGNMDEFIHDIKINVDREFKTEENNKVCEAIPNYKYEYEKIKGQNIKLKQYSVMYKEVIENLAMLLNKEI